MADAQTREGGPSGPVVPAHVPLIDLASQRRRLGGKVEAAIARVLEHGSFILGPEVAQLEERLAAYVGSGQAVTCSSGTDALVMAFMARGVGAGAAVVVPSFTFAATAEAVVHAGAVPVFADVLADTFDLDPKSVELAVDAATSAGLRPAAVVAVDLYGQPADYDAIAAVCAARDLLLVADAAQSFGGAWRDLRVGALADITTTSFFPSKPLGCYGDGGAIFTADGDVAEALRSVRVHGRGTSKYDNVRVGLNARLDTLQAAILLEKLELVDEERDARARVAAAYNERLSSTVSVPAVRAGATSAWASYTARVDHRDDVAAALAASGVSTAIYYPKPLHRQPAYADYPRATEDLGVSDALAATVLSLPMHAYLDEASQDRVIVAVTDAVAGRSWPTGGTRGSGSKRLVVIGGAGFIGSHTVDALLREDVDQLVIYDNLARGGEANLADALTDPRVSVWKGNADICDRDALNAALQGANGVLHFAALWLTQCQDSPARAFEVNSLGTFNVVEACVNQHVQRLVLSSSASVYGDAVEEPMTEGHPLNAITIYGATKIAAEAMTRAMHHRYGLPYVGLRYMNVYGPRQVYDGADIAVVMKMLNAVDAGEPLVIFGDGSQAYDFVDVRDCANANVCAMRADTTDRFYNVGIGKGTSIAELAELVVRLTGAEAGVRYEPSGQTFVKNRIGDPGRAWDEIGFRATVELEDGMRDLIAWRTADKALRA